MKILELLLKIFDSIELTDLKCLLGNFGSWYLAAEQDIKEITGKEQKKDPFANDTFETFKGRGSADSSDDNVKDIDIGDLRPDSALLR